MQERANLSYLEAGALRYDFYMKTVNMSPVSERIIARFKSLAGRKRCYLDRLLLVFETFSDANRAVYY